MTVRFDVCVIGGAGHVGLPLSIAFALRGKRVAIVDADRAALARIGQGSMPFVEEGGGEGLRGALASGRLELCSDPAVIADSAHIVLVIGTPIDGHLSPSFHAMAKVLEQYAEHFRDGQVIILRSTLYPGSSERVLRWVQARGFDIHVATCPERIAQGYALKEIFSLPQVISSFSSEGLRAVRELFASLTEDIVEVEPIEAELAKLFNNSWRYMKFAAANQFYMIANNTGADVERIWHAVSHGYPRGADLPKPGFAAGPCLFKDTMQLASFTNNSFFLGHSAMLINEGLPQYVVDRIRLKHNLADKRIAILGMAFKADIDDERDSLSTKLKDLLEMEAGEVICSDPFISHPGIVPAEEAVRLADIIVIGAPHSCYRTVALDGKPAYDVWGILGKGSNI